MGGGASPRPLGGKGPYGPFSGHSRLLHLQWPLITNVFETNNFHTTDTSIVEAETNKIYNVGIFLKYYSPQPLTLCTATSLTKLYMPIFAQFE